MELIKEIYEGDLDLDKTSNPDLIGAKNDVCYRLRRAARALIFYKDKIAMLNAEKLNLHKLPGGGIEKIESKVDGLHREILEETGCKITKTALLGITLEYRDKIEMLQISYVFTCNVADVAGKPNFTQKERSEGFKLTWLTVPEVINVMKNEDSPNTYAGKFIHARDLAILQYYVGHIS